MLQGLYIETTCILSCPFIAHAVCISERSGLVLRSHASCTEGAVLKMFVVYLTTLSLWACCVACKDNSK